jgi:predicted nuclease of restriction endonuclease-like (RecB) superfamily
MSEFPANQEDSLFGELKDLIVRARERVAVQVNQTLVMTYWQIGRKLETEVLQLDSHRYGEATMTRLAERLTQEFGGGFSYRNLYRMVLFFQRFPEPEILTTLSSKCSWSHCLEFIKVVDPTKRDFYVQVCSTQGWSVRQLRREMDSLLFERTMLSRQPEGVIRQELAKLESDPAEASPNLFLKDPYLLDFLIDLLFYHRKLKRLVVVELKMGEFRPEHKGQVELYLKWLARHDAQPDEKPPIAIILCTTRDAEIVELLDLEKDHIHVAEYWVQLPPREVLQARLHEAMAAARARLEADVRERAGAWGASSWTPGGAPRERVGSTLGWRRSLPP